MDGLKCTAQCHGRAMSPFPPSQSLTSFDQTPSPKPSLLFFGSKADQQAFVVGTHGPYSRRLRRRLAPTHPKHRSFAAAASTQRQLRRVWARLERRNPRGAQRGRQEASAELLVLEGNRRRIRPVRAPSSQSNAMQLEAGIVSGKSSLSGERRRGVRLVPRSC